jgi:hypothetical protein
MAKKVGQKEQNDVKKGRIDFVTKTAKIMDENKKLVSAINKDGLLISVPKTVTEGGKVLYEGFDMRKHNPLKKGDFADIATYLDHQAFIAREKGNRLIALAEDKEKKAERIRKFGDEDTRKKAAKIARMREQLAALEQQLTAEGIDVENL